MLRVHAVIVRGVTSRVNQIQSDGEGLPNPLK